ncbi:hypothetical protein [Leptolyngbya sp. CCY15150]|uniref:hypothetical protein n=1 Tax=Leptolyngbya sp. CCY15150 TaxID=2767772 RepID=UPI00195289D4|nr:hypothetical protein [Leptolyngbya sp. CCY15150]
MISPQTLPKLYRLLWSTLPSLPTQFHQMGKMSAVEHNGNRNLVPLDNRDRHLPYPVQILYFSQFRFDLAGYKRSRLYKQMKLPY